MFGLSRGSLYDMSGYFGDGNSGMPFSVPAKAQLFGFIIQDKYLRREMMKGIRANHIPFQYIEQIPTVPKQANYDSYETLGRFENLQVYKSSNAIDFSISLIYYAEATEDPNLYISPPRTSWTIENIERFTRRLQSLVYPKYDGKYSPPNLVLLNMGGIHIDVPIKIRSVSVVQKPPFTFNKLKPFRQDIQIEAFTTYPLWQALGADVIEKSTYVRQDDLKGNRVFSYKRYSRINNK